MSRCTRALEDGTRCTSVIPKGHATCDLHRRWNLGISLTPTQKKVMYNLWRGGRYYLDAPMSGRRMGQMLEILIAKKMATTDEQGNPRLTDWGKDIIGNSRTFDKE